MIKTISSSITDIRESGQVIAHQCNCLTTGRAKGVARQIFETFPYSDIYSDRKAPDVPGQIIVRHPEVNQAGPIVVNLLAQFHPGKPRLHYDTAGDRETWLSFCLKKMLDSVASSTFYFPFGMGCNLAGGDWGKTIDLMGRIADVSGKEFVFCLNPK